MADLLPENIRYVDGELNQDGLSLILYAHFPGGDWYGKKAMFVSGGMLFPEHPVSLITGENPSAHSLRALTPKGWTLSGADANPGGIYLMGKDKEGKTRLLLKRWLANPDKPTRGFFQDTLTLPLPDSAWVSGQTSGMAAHLYLSPNGPGFTLEHADSGGWQLSFIMGEDWFDVYPTFLYFNKAPESDYAIGTLPWGDASALDFAALPLTFQEAVKHMDQKNWAMVNNPNPLLSLPLREKPEPGAKSLGEFYNGTPLRVIERKGEWARVALPGLTGWMMDHSLAFDKDMNQVQPAYLHRMGADGTLDQNLPVYTRPDEASPVAFRRNIFDGNDYWVVGVAEDAWFCVYFPREDMGGFMTQDLFSTGDN